MAAGRATEAQQLPAHVAQQAPVVIGINHQLQADPVSGKVIQRGLHSLQLPRLPECLGQTQDGYAADFVLHADEAFDKRIGQCDDQHLMSASLQIASQPPGVITDAIAPRL